MQEASSAMPGDGGSDEYDDGRWTPCPSWCDHPDHDGAGKWHHGATFLLAPAGVRLGERVDISVVKRIYPPFVYAVDISAEGTLTASEARQVLEGLTRALALVDELGAV